MRPLLRLIAVWELLLAALFLLLSALLIFGAGSQARTPRAWLLLAGFIIVSPLAAFAGFHLWRFREVGRRASIGLFILFMLISLVQGASFTGGAVFKWGLMVTVFALLLSPAVSRICTMSHPASRGR